MCEFVSINYCINLVHGGVVVDPPLLCVSVEGSDNLIS